MDTHKTEPESAMPWVAVEVAILAAVPTFVMPVTPKLSSHTPVARATWNRWGLPGRDASPRGAVAPDS
jgi:hypothetical protein